MTLQCGRCGSGLLEIIAQSYSQHSAYEVYECEECGNKGSLRMDSITNQQSLSGLESDG